MCEKMCSNRDCEKCLDGMRKHAQYCCRNCKDMEGFYKRRDIKKLQKEKDIKNSVYENGIIKVDNKFSIEEIELLLGYRSSNCFDTFCQLHTTSARIFIDWLKNSSIDGLKEIIKYKKEK